jgi:hypothetical protein
MSREDDPTHPFDGKFEPEAKDIITSQSDAALVSIAVSLKRIADAFDSSDSGGRPQGSVLWWMETMASAANAGRS